MPLQELPEELRRRLPRYGSVPAIRMERLAVDTTFKGLGLGGALLVNALRRSASSDILAVVLIVDAKDKPAAAFYRHHGFVPLSDSPLTLFLPLAHVR